MNLKIAKERMGEVLKPDSITSSQGDFLATHVSMKNLLLLRNFDMKPEGKNLSAHSEDEVYQKYIRNLSNKHQFIAVYGQSGTGKSHLIRWFGFKFMHDKPENEVALFIRRSDNSLKGTIRQLLDQPEVQNVKNKDVIERLVKASQAVPDNILKETIYHSFIIEINNDERTDGIQLSSVKRKRLVAFLSNESIQERMMHDGGPIERIFSKIAEHSMIATDTVAQFKADDFAVDPDLYEAMQHAGADIKASSEARTLLADEDGAAESKILASYINQFVDTVVQRCAGIEPGDFEQIFSEIRKELFRQGKNLTLFIEDITSFTGVDTALLNALMEEHTGMYAQAGLCRISSILGGTSSYIGDFRDNHKDRITQYVYIPDGGFDNQSLFELFGRYINTMSLPEQTIAEWSMQGAKAEEYPVHEAKQGAVWESCNLSGKKLCLYPFTQKSIVNLYTGVLAQGQKTIRYIIQRIISPVIQEAMDHPDGLPSLTWGIISVNSKLDRTIHNKLANHPETADRLARFMAVWGDNTDFQYTDNDDVTYIAGLRKEVYDDFKLPVIALTSTEAPIPPKLDDPERKDPSQEDNKKTEPAKKSEIKIAPEKQQRLVKASEILNKWRAGAEIDIAITAGAPGIVREARDDMCTYLMGAINWQVEGVSLDNMRKIRDSSAKLMDFERQAKNRTPGFYVLPANWDSCEVVKAFIRWSEYGNRSFSYPESDYDVYLITAWAESVKGILIKAVKFWKVDTDSQYVEASLISELYRMILRGDIGVNKQAKNVDEKDILSVPVSAVNTDNGHSKEWNALLKLIADKGNDSRNHDTAVDYFNVRQGDGGSKVVLQADELSQTIKSIKAKSFYIAPEQMQKEDKVKGRKDTYEYLDSIQTRVEAVAEAEKAKAVETIRYLNEQLTDDDFDTIDVELLSMLLDNAKEFYQEANSTQINISTANTDQVKQQAKQIASAIERINAALGSQDTIGILTAFSDDPLTTIKPLTCLLQTLSRDMDTVDKQIEKKSNDLGINSETEENAEMLILAETMAKDASMFEEAGEQQ